MWSDMPFVKDCKRVWGGFGADDAIELPLFRRDDGRSVKAINGAGAFLGMGRRKIMQLEELAQQWLPMPLIAARRPRGLRVRRARQMRQHNKPFAKSKKVNITSQNHESMGEVRFDRATSRAMAATNVHVSEIVRTL